MTQGQRYHGDTSLKLSWSFFRSADSSMGISVALAADVEQFDQHLQQSGN